MRTGIWAGEKLADLPSRLDAYRPPPTQLATYEAPLIIMKRAMAVSICV